MKMTQQQRERFEHALGHAYGRLKTLIDGTEVSFEVRRGKGLSYLIMHFIDGHFQGRWVRHDNDELGARLMRVRSERVNSKKLVSAWRKIDRQHAKKMDEKRLVTRHFFHCPVQLRKHIERNFSEFEILDDAGEA